MATKPSPKKKATEQTGADLWPVLVEFTLSQRVWWLGICAEFDLTPMQGQALRALTGQAPAPMSGLADLLICDASNVTGIVDKLEARGLIERRSAENDRRIKILAVTPKGCELQEKLNARVMEPPKAVSRLPQASRKALVALLREILAERGGQ